MMRPGLIAPSRNLNEVPIHDEAARSGENDDHRAI